MERYKDSDLAFLVGMLFVLMFVWLSAFVCICLSVCASVRVPLLYVVCVLPSLSAQCALETVVVFCWLGLPCPVLSWVVLSCLVLSVCHQSVLSLCCVYSSSRSPSFVCPWVIPFVLSFLCSSFVQGVSC